MVDVDDSTKAFLVEVRRYCHLIEHDGDDSQGNSWKFARNCLISIVNLYSAALFLPIIEFDKSDASLDDVIWHWSSSFETHWGQHAVGAIAALNALCFGQFPDLNRPQDT